MDPRRIVLLIALLVPAAARAQEKPSFVTYNHHMEEPRSLEVGLNSLGGTQRGGGSFVGSWLELEYGVKGWWTTELYLDGQGTRGQGSATPRRSASATRPTTSRRSWPGACREGRRSGSRPPSA